MVRGHSDGNEREVSGAMWHGKVTYHDADVELFAVWLVFQADDG